MTTEFINTVTKGFASVNEPAIAVCLRSGTELAFDLQPEYWRPSTRWWPRKRPSKLASSVARFCQMDLHRPDTHRDALEFPDGTIVLLTSLCPGQRATVLQLPGGLQITAEPNEQKLPVHAG